MIDQPLVCLFVKAPVLGTVKTRLAETLGDDLALDAYLQLVEHGLTMLADLQLPLRLWVDGGVQHPAVVRWAAQLGATVHRQVEGDLGAKMHAALTDGLDDHSAAMVIGSDLPEVDAQYLHRASDLLTSNDVVFGPTEDGGYALVGLNVSVAGLFEDIAWSTNQVFDQSLTRAAELGLSVGLLSLTWDVDEPYYWHRFQRLKRVGKPSQSIE